jgi:hypothetical protein
LKCCCEFISTIWPPTSETNSRLVVADRYLAQDENSGGLGEETIAINVLGATLVAGAVIVAVVAFCDPFKKGQVREGQKEPVDGGAI